MDSDDFRVIESGLADSHAQMAELLGISEVSVKRYATGAQPIPVHVARLSVALLLLSKEGLHPKFQKLLVKYHCDT